jgi:nitroreductase
MFIINSCGDARQNEEAEVKNKIIKLNQPNFENGITLMEAFQNRQSSRSFSDKPIGQQDLSNLLWAAAGINRDNGGKTIPLLGDIAIYVAMESGVYLYNSEKHELQQILNEDVRKEICSQSPVQDAPVTFIMTIDDESFPSYMKKAMEDAHGMDFYYGNQVAYSTQNIYLYACSNNMNSVVIGGYDMKKTDKLLGLGENHHSFLLQPVGYRK